MRGAAFVAPAAVIALAIAGCGGSAHSPRSRPSHPPTVVAIAVHGPTIAADTATGFAVGGDRIVTVAHVVEPSRVIDARTPDGRTRRARVVRLDRADDLALLAVPGVAATPVRIRGGVVGAALLLLPHAAVAATVTRRVTATMRAPNAPPYVRPALELRARVDPGDSGAPVVDRSGAVGGVLFARSDDRVATAWAVDASALTRLLR